MVKLLLVVSIAMVLGGCAALTKRANVEQSYRECLSQEFKSATYSSTADMQSVKCEREYTPRAQ